MKLEDALDRVIEGLEAEIQTARQAGYVPANVTEDLEAVETILRCADQEWQRREMREDTVARVTKLVEDLTMEKALKLLRPSLCENQEPDCLDCHFKPGEE